MDINKLKVQLSSSISEGLANKYEDVKASFGNEGLYAYMLYSASGFYALCIAASTEKSLIHVKKTIRESENEVLESLKAHPDLLSQFSPSSDLYAEMTASEWEYIYSDIPEFENLDSVVGEIYEYSYKESNQHFNVNEFLNNCILEGIKNFQKSSDFDTELLTGIQFGDPSEQEIQIVKKISRQVNQTRWHEKIMDLHIEQATL